jgi:FkbH-like protein
MPKNHHQIKCLVWDLDNTLWNGILSEKSTVILNPQAVTAIKELDKRGVLQSIASKNNFEDAMTKLQDFKLADYFLYPQINWEPKSKSIDHIAKKLNISLDTVAFIDDQQFELEEVSFSLPEILTISRDRLDGLLKNPVFTPRFITEDSKIRRSMYQNEIQRNELEESFIGSKEAFLRTLQMQLTIAEASLDDLQRAEELTVRTHQLNTTGYTYSYDELNQFRNSKSHVLLVADLRDKYGPYGKIGLVLLEKKQSGWVIKLLLMSCRVMSRGIGSVLINYLRRLAYQNKVKLMAEFVLTKRNRMMLMTYKFTGFMEKKQTDNHILFENNLASIPACPDYLKLYA